MWAWCEQVVEDRLRRREASKRRGRVDRLTSITAGAQTPARVVKVTEVCLHIEELSRAYIGGIQTLPCSIGRCDIVSGFVLAATE
jgi:hypothetical protein